MGGLVGPSALLWGALGVHLDSLWEFGVSFFESWGILFDPEFGKPDFHKNLSFLLFFNDFACRKGLLWRSWGLRWTLFGAYWGQDGVQRGLDGDKTVQVGAKRG